MATPFTTKIDINIVLGRLRPASEFHWKGSGFGTYADIGDWRDPNTTKPTEAQVYAEWDVYLAEQAQKTADDTTLRTHVITIAQSAVGISIDALAAGQVRALVAILLWQAGALNPDGTVRPLAQWVK